MARSLNGNGVCHAYYSIMLEFPVVKATPRNGIAIPNFRADEALKVVDIQEKKKAIRDLDEKLTDLKNRGIESLESLSKEKRSDLNKEFGFLCDGKTSATKFQRREILIFDTKDRMLTDKVVKARIEMGDPPLPVLYYLLLNYQIVGRYNIASLFQRVGLGEAEGITNLPVAGLDSKLVESSYSGVWVNNEIVQKFTYPSKKKGKLKECTIFGEDPDNKHYPLHVPIAKELRKYGLLSQNQELKAEHFVKKQLFEFLLDNIYNFQIGPIGVVVSGTSYRKIVTSNGNREQKKVVALMLDLSLQRIYKHRALAFEAIKEELRQRAGSFLEDVPSYDEFKAIPLGKFVVDAAMNYDTEVKDAQAVRSLHQKTMQLRKR